MDTITWQDFEKIDIRIGTIIETSEFPEARRPAYKLKIDFGKGVGVLKSSAQITQLYQPDGLIGQQVVAVVNFSPKQIGNFMSECLVLGAVNNNGEVVLLQPEKMVDNGLKIA